MEQDGPEQPSATVGRSQNVVYVIPQDWAAIPQFLAPLVERIADAEGGVSLLVVTGDDDTSAAIAESAVELAGERMGVVAATSAKRAARALQGGGARIVAGTPDTLLALVRDSTLKLDQLRALLVAWADDVAQPANAAALESLLGELSKETARVFVTGEATPEVEALVERYARRARRVTTAGPAEGTQVPAQYVTVSRHARLPALRRLLDTLDPEDAVVWTRDEELRARATSTLRSLGYSGERPAVRMAGGDAATADARMLILLDLPASAQELRDLMGERKPRLIAFVQPRQIAALRSLIGGNPAPLTLPEAGRDARARADQLRAELREILASGASVREVLTLEPLLEEHDGVEVAAAALHLLERERARPAVAERVATGPMTKIFMSIGSRDGIRPGDLVGVIANEGGVSSADVGRIEIRESHSVVEVSAPLAEAVIAAVTGKTIKGRQLLARVDERPERAGRDASRSARPRPPRDRDERPRSGGDRPRPGSDRPRFDRDDRPRSPRPPRPPRSRDRE